MSAENNNELMVKEQIAEDFAKAFQGKMEQSLLDETIQKIKADTNSYTASYGVILFIGYINAHVEISQALFTGNGSGAISGIAGGMGGVVYTDDLNKLIRDTVSFSTLIAPTYSNVLFFDKGSHLLGHFQGGGVSIGGGVGGGPGSWKKR